MRFSKMICVRSKSFGSTRQHMQQIFLYHWPTWRHWRKLFNVQIGFCESKALKLIFDFNIILYFDRFIRFYCLFSILAPKNEQAAILSRRFAIYVSHMNARAPNVFANIVYCLFRLDEIPRLAAVCCTWTLFLFVCFFFVFFFCTDDLYAPHRVCAVRAQFQFDFWFSAFTHSLHCSVRTETRARANKIYY